MKRIYILLTGVLVAAASGAAIASAHGTAPTAHASAAAKVELRHTRIGSILTSSSGLTLYLFTHDHGSENSCLKVHNCPKFWPAYETSGTPVAGPGVKSSLLSTIRIAGGAKQVTYAGHPLYTFSEDKPGETGYVGASSFGGVWEALSASGHPVK
jgi:predicted lipoprotein with Yx(FWY)xxD motif